MVSSFRLGFSRPRSLYFFQVPDFRIFRETLENSTIAIEKSDAHLKMKLSVVVDPSDDHVGYNPAVVLRETETHVAEGLHLNLERNVRLAGCPE